MQSIMPQNQLKRRVVFILAFLTAAALFGGSVHLVLVAANLAEPSANTVYGVTDKRIWSSAAFVLALIALVGGWLALRPNRRFGRLEATVALVGGLIALVNGWLVLVTADGGPNSGNGVVAGAMAVVVGFVSMILGGLALFRLARRA